MRRPGPARLVGHAGAPAWRAGNAVAAPRAAPGRRAAPGSAAARLARSRQAIVEYLAPPQWAAAREGESDWLAGMRAAGGSWWRAHPARLLLDLAMPPLASYARRRPWTFLVLAATGGALVAVARPWRLLSVTGLLLAVAKSSRLSSLVPLAFAALRPGRMLATREPPVADPSWRKVDAT